MDLGKSIVTTKKDLSIAQVKKWYLSYLIMCTLKMTPFLAARNGAAKLSFIHTKKEKLKK